MGSWAKSLHVRANDASAVVDALRAIVLAEGYQPDTSPAPTVAVAFTMPGPGQQEPTWLETTNGRGEAAGREMSDEDWDEDDRLFIEALDRGDEGVDAGEAVSAGDPEPRGICVYRPVDGWVGVLDSGDIYELGERLSARLHTDALVAMVNDSDGWCYALLHHGRLVDDFSSLGDTGDDSVMSPELRDALQRGDEDRAAELLEQELLRNAPRGPIRLPFGGTMMPPEMALLQGRIEEGRASWWQHLRYRWLWLRFVFRLLTGRFRADDRNLGFDIPRQTPLTGEEIRRHIAQVQEMFPSARANALRGLLPLSRFPAENLLVDFFKIVGLPGLYGYLSYSYLDDHTEDELAEEGIVRVAELRFLPPAGTP